MKSEWLSNGASLEAAGHDGDRSQPYVLIPYLTVLTAIRAEKGLEHAK